MPVYCRVYSWCVGFVFVMLLSLVIELLQDMSSLQFSDFLSHAASAL